MSIGGFGLRDRDRDRPIAVLLTWAWPVLLIVALGGCALWTPAPDPTPTFTPAPPFWQGRSAPTPTATPEPFGDSGRESMDTLVEGIIIGASAGLVSSILFGLIQWTIREVQRRAERRDQIRHLAGTIERGRDEINSASDLDLTNHPVGRLVQKDEIRKAYLGEMYRQVLGILEVRASRLSFDETQQVRQAFHTLALYPAWVPNDNGYNGIFSQLEAIEWLTIRR